MPVNILFRDSNCTDRAIHCERKKEKVEIIQCSRTCATILWMLFQASPFTDGGDYQLLPWHLPNAASTKAKVLQCLIIESWCTNDHLTFCILWKCFPINPSPLVILQKSLSFSCKSITNSLSAAILNLLPHQFLRHWFHDHNNSYI